MIDHDLLGVELALDIADLGVHLYDGPERAAKVCDLYNAGRAQQLFGCEITPVDVAKADQSWEADLVDIPPEGAEFVWW